MTNYLDNPENEGNHKSKDNPKDKDNLKYDPKKLKEVSIPLWLYLSTLPLRNKDYFSLLTYFAAHSALRHF